MRRGFTLIELLLVLVIVAVLMMVTEPSVHEASTRSKVARAKSDLRSLARAIETYRLDHNDIPPDGDDPDAAAWFAHRGGPIQNVLGPDHLSVLGSPAEQQARLNRCSPRMWTFLTTPTAYTSTFYIDPFSSGLLPSYDTTHMPDASRTQRAYALISSVGPDGQLTGVPSGSQPIDFLYDPTNGTESSGEIMRAAGFADGTATVEEYGLGLLVPVDYPR